MPQIKMKDRHRLPPHHQTDARSASHPKRPPAQAPCRLMSPRPIRAAKIIKEIDDDVGAAEIDAISGPAAEWKPTLLIRQQVTNVDMHRRRYIQPLIPPEGYRLNNGTNSGKAGVPYFDPSPDGTDTSRAICVWSMHRQLLTPTGGQRADEG